MASYIAGRLIQALPVLVLASVAVFLVVRLVPGDPAEAAAGENAPAGRVDEIRADLGLDQPVPVQYARWIMSVGQGDFGMSFEKGVPVRRLFAIALPPTIELALVAFPLAVLIGIPLGTVAGVRPGSGADWLVSVGSALAISVPGFVLASLLLWAFAIDLGWLPASGRVSVLADPVGGLKSLALPAAALALGPAAVLARFTRTSVSQVCRVDYVRTARAKGLAERAVVWRHVLPTALVPVITISSLQLGQMLSGAIVVERVFTRPGIGSIMVRAVQDRDYPVVQGGLLILVATFVAVNLAADLAYGLIDPRTRP